MARPPPKHEPEVTDLTRYRRAKAAAARRAPKTKPPKASFLGSNPRAGLILAVVVIVALLLYVAPRFF